MLSSTQTPDSVLVRSPSERAHFFHPRPRPFLSLFFSCIQATLICQCDRKIGREHDVLLRLKSSRSKFTPFQTQTSLSVLTLFKRTSPSRALLSSLPNRGAPVTRPANTTPRIRTHCITS